METHPADDAFDFSGAFPRSWAVIRSGLEAGLHIGGQIYISVQGKPAAHIAFGLAREGLSTASVASHATSAGIGN